MSFIAVVDVGKSVSKLTLFDDEGRARLRRSRANARVGTAGRRVLDVDGIEVWLRAELTACGPLKAVVPVGHGAAAALVRGDRLACAPLDYENPAPTDERRAYDAGRDPFVFTGSPALPQLLNLGFQLHLLDGEGFGDAAILPWPQYWAWRLSGEPAAEVTSLGCHTDLWRPGENAPSALAGRRGWGGRLAPLRPAGEVLGTARPEWGGGARVFCGVHDSNAALHAVRGHPELQRREFTVLSTGTWFVALRSPGAEAVPPVLDETRDCLLNVDVDGRPTPSARVMGGRRLEELLGPGAPGVDAADDQPRLLAAVDGVLRSGAMARADGGAWLSPADDGDVRSAAACLDAALAAAELLDLIGTEARLVVEGRFARAEVFVRALARLRPDLAVWTVGDYDAVACGGLRLAVPDLVPPEALRPVAPLDQDLADYARRWRRALRPLEAAR